MCAVARKGAAEAGAVFIVIRHESDRLSVYGPPPGPAYDESGRRRWHASFDGQVVGQAEVDQFLDRQTNIDPDIWVVDIDDPTGNGLLDIEAIE